VLTAHDGAATIEVLHREKIDLVLLDIHMPVKSGWDVYQEFCTPYGHFKYPIMVLTSSSNLEGFFDQIEVDAFIGKPFEFEELGRQIKKVFEKLETPRVLIVTDNNSPHKEGLMSALKIERYPSIIVEDLEELKSKMQIYSPEYILMEYLHPGSRGDDFIRQIRQMQSEPPFDKTPPAPILVYSFSGFDYAEKSLASGAARYLAKPENYGTIISAFREIEFQKRKDD
jgi:DNA-binding response OmpR family regulator